MALYQKHNNHKTFFPWRTEKCAEAEISCFVLRRTSAQGVLCGLWACRRVQRFVGLRLYKHVEIDGINGGVVTFWVPKSKWGIKLSQITCQRADKTLGYPLTLARIRCFATFGRTGGGVGATPPLGVSKRSVVELSGKDQQIALAEYSRLVVLFLVLG